MEFRATHPEIDTNIEVPFGPSEVKIIRSIKIHEGGLGKLPYELDPDKVIIKYYAYNKPSKANKFKAEVECFDEYHKAYYKAVDYDVENQKNGVYKYI